jgi:FkbM family methyltransferase
VFDVGVATGTPDLYGVFEDVRYALIEPLLESKPFMDRLVEAHPGSVAIHAAAGAAAGEATIVVPSNLSGSSFLLKPKSGVQRTVPVVTLDEVARAHALPGPYLLKLDVQGYELEVLAGAEQVLAQTGALIAEVSLWSDRKGLGMAQLLPMLTWLGERGLVLYDIAAIVRRDFDDAITEMDLVFVPAASPLRADSRYKRTGELESSIAKRRRSFGLE